MRTYATLTQNFALVKQLTYFPGNTLRFIILTFALFSELREKFPFEVKIVPCAKKKIHASCVFCKNFLQPTRQNHEKTSIDNLFVIISPYQKVIETSLRISRIACLVNKSTACYCPIHNPLYRLDVKKSFLKAALEWDWTLCTDL